MASGKPQRPARGLPPEEALEHWSDPEAYAAMREYWQFRPSSFFVIGGVPPSEGELEFNRRRRPLVEALLERLRSGELMATAIPDNANPTASRRLLDPEVFSHGSLSFETAQVVLTRRKSLRHVEIFEPPGVPLNVRTIPRWYREQFEPAQTAVHSPGADAAERQGEAGFRQEADYRRVWIDGHEFRLTHLQAKVVKILHHAHLENDPWRSGKKVLQEAGSRSMQMFQVFRSQGTRWSYLIESRGDGRYRLNIRK